MPNLWDSQYRHATYYLDFAREHSQDFELLHSELGQFRIVRDWLANEEGSEASKSLVTLTRLLSDYLQNRSLHRELLDFCNKAITVSSETELSFGWLTLLRYDTYFALGEWDNALTEVLLAIEASRKNDPKTYAQAMLALGRLQMNQGNYKQALETLSQAENLLIDIGDLEGLASARSEVAAYYMNRGHLDHSLSLYLKVDELQQSFSNDKPTNYILFMLGVVYRKKGNYEEAAKLLGELLNRGIERSEQSTIATASHHLAWVYLNQGNIYKAEQFGTRAKEIYSSISNIRGVSDADEQLGMVAFANGEMDEALCYLEQSLIIRRQIGNHHGVASSLRHIGTINYCRTRYISGIINLLRSLYIYWQLGVLSCHRLISMAKEFMIWVRRHETWTI
jgi:tetratricopeptide (TPR) repeat protein